MPMERANLHSLPHHYCSCYGNAALQHFSPGMRTNPSSTSSPGELHTAHNSRVAQPCRVAKGPTSPGGKTHRANTASGAMQGTIPLPEHRAYGCGDMDGLLAQNTEQLDNPSMIFSPLCLQLQGCSAFGSSEMGYKYEEVKKRVRRCEQHYK